MEAVLQFKDYHVLETHYLFNPNINYEEEIKIRPKFTYKFKLDEDNKKQSFITLGVSLGDENLIESSFYVSALILGLFIIRANDDINEEIVFEMFKPNAVAILFPYLRSLVSDLTSRGSEAPIILPTLNISEMIKSQEKQN